MRQSSLLIRGRFGALAVADRTPLELPADDSADWDAFERFAKRQTLRIVKTAALVIVGFTLFWWPLDLLFLSREPHEELAFTSWRIGAIAVFASMYATLSSWPLAARHPEIVSVPFSAAASAVLTHSLASMGGLEQPYFYMAAGTLFIPIVAPAGLPTRLVYTLAITVALFAGFFVADPEHAQSPMLFEAVSFMLSIAVGAMLIGHVGYVGFCRRFFLGLALDRSARSLQQANESLEERVSEKTAALRRLAEHLQVAQEAERGRIAREPHDELGQRLSAVRYVVANVKQRIRRDPSAIVANVEELDTMVSGTLECVRDVVAGLRPPILDQLGLGAAVEWLAQRVGASTGIVLELDIREEIRCDGLSSVAVFRVAQEALTNVVRHAGASRVSVSLQATDDHIELVVVDDGCGFPESLGKSGNCNGLLGMRERAVALAGALETQNDSGGGARVRLTLPMSRAGRPEVTSEESG